MGIDKKGLSNAKALKIMYFLLVPGAGIEPAWAQGPLDFESSASTNFTTPAGMRIYMQYMPTCQSLYRVPLKRPQSDLPSPHLRE